MINVLKKFYTRCAILWLLIVVIFSFSMTFESPFQKGGMPSDYLDIIALVLLFISISIFLFFRKQAIIERLFIVLPISFASLILDDYICGEVIDNIWQDKTWFLWEAKNAIPINFVFYGSYAILVLIMFVLYNYLKSLKLKIKRKKDQQPI